MSHDRGGPAVIGAVAALVLSGDLFYSASRWAGSFRHAFLVALVAFSVVGVVSVFLAFVYRVGSRRRAIGWQRTANVLAVILIFAFLAVTGASRNDVGAVFGEVAALAGGFALYCVIWLGLHRA
jgi:hypothetical protein